MKLSKNKKGAELDFLLFLVLFIVVMGIVNIIFDVDSLVEESQDIEDETFWTWVEGLFSGLSDLIGNIPLIGDFWTFINTSRQFLFIHPYLLAIIGSLFIVPLAYIAMRLIKGGG